MTENELYHYGIKGMKWGVRRYQNKDGSLTSQGRSRYAVNRKDKEVKGPGLDIAVATTALLAPVVIAPLATTLYAKHVEKKIIKEVTELSNERYEAHYASRRYQTLDDVPKLDTPNDPNKSMKEINPGYPQGDTVQNCMMCTTAMIMREKGYKVEANVSSDGYMTDSFKNVYEGIEHFEKPKISKPNDFLNTLASHGNGAYGNVVVYWKNGGGHSLFWKNEGGKTVIYDCQAGIKVDDPLNDLMPYVNCKMTEYVRADNVNITQRALACVR